MKRLLFITLLLSGLAWAGTTPARWWTYALDGTHNAVFSSSFPAVSWTFAVPGATSLDWTIVQNTTSIRDILGFPIGVAVVHGVVFAPNDNGFLYAVDARTGKLLWSANLENQIMTTPIVVQVDQREVVFVGAGNSDFDYTDAVRFGSGGQVIRGTDVSGIAALDARTGALLWFHPTRGEDMPTPVFVEGRLIFGNGDGHIYALDPLSGKTLWKTKITSFVSMSSATPADGGRIVVMGGTHPSRIYAVDSRTGKLLWSYHPQGIFSSSGGDGTWASYGEMVIGQIEIRTPHQAKGTSSAEELALDARTGKLLWSRILGSGKVPPRNKDGVPDIADGVIYTGCPVTHTEYALDLKTGAILWERHLPGIMKAAPLAIGQWVIQPMGNGMIVTLNRTTGAIAHIYHNPHGGFGPQNGVVIGSTYFIGSNTGFLEAIPLAKLLPSS
jgi:outer membrane protein assembly factor BamB